MKDIKKSWILLILLKCRNIRYWNALKKIQTGEAVKMTLKDRRKMATMLQKKEYGAMQMSQNPREIVLNQKKAERE